MTQILYLLLKSILLDSVAFVSRAALAHAAASFQMPPRKQRKTRVVYVFRVVCRCIPKIFFRPWEDSEVRQD